MKWCVIPVKILDLRPTVLWSQKLIHSLPQLTFFLPLLFFAFLLFFFSLFSSSLFFLQSFFLVFCTVWSSQHESRFKLICTANQISVSVFQNCGLHSCYNWALMLCGRVFNSDWLSLCVLTCCFFYVECCRVFFFSHCPSFFPYYNSHIPIRASFLKAVMLILFLLIVDLPKFRRVWSSVFHPLWFPRMQEVNRLAFCWAAVASHWHWPLTLVRKACLKHKRGR